MNDPNCGCNLEELRWYMMENKRKAGVRGRGGQRQRDGERVSEEGGKRVRRREVHKEHWDNTCP